MFRILFIFTISTTLMFSASIGDNLMNADANSDENVVDIVGAGDVVKLGNNKEVLKPKTWKPKKYEREKIWGLLYGKNKTPKNKFLVQKGESDKFINKNILSKNANLVASQNLEQRLQYNQEQRVLESLRGDCIVPFTVRISEAPVQIKVTCKVKNTGDYIDIIMLAIPNNSSMSVVGVPKFYLKDNQSPVPIDPNMSYITNITDTTSNIASYVNTQEIKKSMTYLAQGLGTGISKASQSYMDARKAYRTQQSTTVSGGINPVVTQNTRTAKPNITEEILAGVVGGVFTGIEKMATSLENQYPYLYKIESGSVINFFITPSIATNQRNQTENRRIIK